mmetsp:Transcript_13944/g.39695  ORF Transcript_13944/g.39695 Transcript_13944/m.39695 type:complete len:341 (+) Transcript_13944:171-1193(+)
MHPVTDTLDLSHHDRTTLTVIAVRKPKSVDRPVTFPPCSKASGSTVFAIMHNIAPPQRPSIAPTTFCTTGSSVLPGGKIAAPSSAPKPVRSVMDPHMSRITRRRMPCKRIVLADDIASGKFARKTPTTNATSWAWVAVFARIPMTRLSGTPSMRIPIHIMIAVCKPWLLPCSMPPFTASAVARSPAPSRRSGRSDSAVSSPPGPAKRPAMSDSSLAPPPSSASGSAGLGWSRACGGVACRTQPSSSSAAHPNFAGPAAPSGGSRSTATAKAFSSSPERAPPVALATSACLNRSSRSVSLSMSLRGTISTVVRSTAVAVTGTAWPKTRCSVPSNSLAPTTW